jgi:hypothetical protein
MSGLGGRGCVARGSGMADECRWDKVVVLFGKDVLLVAVVVWCKLGLGELRVDIARVD